MRHRCSAPSELAIPRRWLPRWGGVAAVAVACSLLAPAARTTVPAAQLARVSAAAGLIGTDSPTPVAQLEDRAAKLAKQYRGQLDVLSGAEAAAKAAAGRVRVLDGRLAAAHRQLARLAAASYMGSPPDQALAFFGDGDPEQVLGRAADIEYLARQAFRFTAMSWRRMYPSSTPVTILYSDLIADLLGHLRHVRNWNPDILATKLRSSRWFL